MGAIELPGSHVTFTATLTATAVNRGDLRRASAARILIRPKEGRCDGFSLASIGLGAIVYCVCVQPLADRLILVSILVTLSAYSVIIL